MIFIAFFLFVSLIAVSLIMYNSSNLNEIETYLKTQDCKTYVYSKGSYKALCKHSVLDVANSFQIDFNKNSKEYMYKDIKHLDIQNLDILINDDKKLSFKKKDELYEFYEKLSKIIKSR